MSPIEKARMIVLLLPHSVPEAELGDKIYDIGNLNPVDFVKSCLETDIFPCNGHAVLIQLTHVAIRASEAGWQYNMLANLICIEIVILECISKALVKLRSNGGLVSP